MTSSQNNIVQTIEERLGASYSHDLASGHMGSMISIFNTDHYPLVAKYCRTDNHKAVKDIKDNIYGYKKLRLIGAKQLLPRDIKLIEIRNEVVLVMEYLGLSFRAMGKAGQQTNQNSIFEQRFLELVQQTIKSDNGCKNLNKSISEVTHYIKKFLRPLQPMLDRKLLNAFDAPISFMTKNVGLMLLDFTPDNVFVNQSGIKFIDPWCQKSYLGHPGVSLGQFVALATEIYRLAGSEDLLKRAEELLIPQISILMGSSNTETEKAYLLGQALQFVLSAYVRVESDPDLAGDFAKRSAQLLGLLG